ncbi:hypothetical protein ATO6_00555 [Oceanicola sp. 22II-s10i]|uniref:hypothetical protein n=1 Tax=Oceanicola sp. 22II-s10i TaxID=1317116 RepID=UPI000B5267EB|nr:hypothetical protein [Oceanicola sp. 22II-s10i]OWU85479.1 hypothetical protein ATO6_00555 [Oceanicola sp. 22II-s10i]
MTPDEIESLFTTPEGYRFARWSRPVVPVIFGVEQQTLGVLKAAIEATVFAAGHRMAETDAELGANLMIFFLRDWQDLAALDNLDRMIPDLHDLLPRLEQGGALQYRTFRFDEAGGIKAAFVFLRMAGGLADQPAADLGLEQAVKALLLWGPGAFRDRSPLAVPQGGGDALLHPDVAALMRAAYEPVMPVAADDASHALRLSARMGLTGH